MERDAGMPTSNTLKDVDMTTVRRRVIGGSDVAAIVGVHPYRTQHDVWLEKMGLQVVEENEAMYWGKVLEPIVLAEYERREGVTLTRFTFPSGFRRHATYTWMGANLDAVVQDRPIGVDAKTAGIRQASRWGEPGTDDIPDEALLQMQWYLAVTEQYERWDVAVLLGQQYRIYRVLPNTDLQRTLVEICGEWWERYVLEKTPPPPDASLSARRMLERLYPMHIEELRPADDLADTLARQYRQVDAQVNLLVRERDRLRNELCALIGDAAGLRGADWRITWTAVRGRTVTDWQAVAREVASDLALYAERLRAVDPAAPAPQPLEARAAAHTTQAASYRRFLTHWERDGEEGAR